MPIQAYNRQAPEIWRSIREGGCPVAHSDRYHGMWVPLTHQYVAEIAYDTEHYTSRGVVVSRGTMDDFPEGPIGGAPPITSDPPFHHHARRILLPPFSPKAIERWEPEIRRLCAELAGSITTAGDSVFDASLHYAQHIPVNVIAACSVSRSRTTTCSTSSSTTPSRPWTPPRAAHHHHDRLDAHLEKHVAEHVFGQATT